LFNVIAEWWCMGGVIVGSGLLGLSLYDAFVAEMLDEGRYHQWSGRSKYNTEQGGTSSVEQEAIFGSQVKWFIGLAIALTFASLGFLCWESCMWHQRMDNVTRSPSPMDIRVRSAMRSKRDALGVWSSDGDGADLEAADGASFPKSGLRASPSQQPDGGEERAFMPLAEARPPAQAPRSVVAAVYAGNKGLL
jgi:hypothetical protein